MSLGAWFESDVRFYIGVLVLSVIVWFFLSFKGSLFSVKYLLNWLKIYSHRRKVKKRLSNYDKIANMDASLEELGLVCSPHEYEWENPRKTAEGVNDGIHFAGVDANHNVLDICLNKIENKLANVWISLNLTEHGTFRLPDRDTRTFYSGNELSFDAGSLQIRCISPLRRWRISFNGVLRYFPLERGKCDSEGELVHVRFSFIWSSFTLVHDCITGYQPKRLSTAFTEIRSKAYEIDMVRFEEAQNRYEQWGQMMGTVQVNGEVEWPVYLWSARTRILDKPSWEKHDESVKLYAYFTNGIILKIEATSLESLISNYIDGHWMSSGGKEYPISNCTLRIDELRQKIHDASNLWISFDRNGQRENTLLSLDGGKTELNIGPLNQRKLIIRPFTIKMAGEDGYGVIYYSHKDENPPQVPPKLPRVTLNATDQESWAYCSWVLSLEDALCQSPLVSGGKGCSLALLTKASKHISQFIVPNGFVVTTAAFQEHVKSQKNLSDALKSLEDSLRNSNVDLKIECEKCCQTFSATPLSSILKIKIKDQLSKQFESPDSVKFAVRSSATGEDSEEISAAGQMLTLLGIKGIEYVYKAVAECWASQFRFENVQYSRQHGCPVVSPMAVVIQEMIASDVAGVMFTVDPLTGNPFYPSINANYGLGESVVAAAADPDYYRMKRLQNNTVSLHDKKAGSKTSRVVMSDEGGVVEEDMPHASETFCLTDTKAEELGNICLLVEECFSSPRDIEWAINRGRIYLLQARPITTLHSETKFELLHEFDTPLKSNYEFLTRANTGEVFLGAATPLGISLVVNGMDLYGHRNFIVRQKIPGFDYVPYCVHWLPVTHRQVTISITDTIFRLNEPEITPSQIAFLVAIFGRVIDTKEIHEFGLRKYGRINKLQKYMGMALLVFFSFRLPNLIGNMSQKVANFSINAEDLSTSAEAFKSIADQMPLYGMMCGIHGMATYLSSIYNAMVLYVLSKGSKDWDSKLYSDISNLLSSCTGVESADVPASLQETAKSISDEHGKDFSNISPEAAYSLLQQKDGPAKKRFGDFLKKHGHRCVKEFDVASTSWGMAPLYLVEILQNLVKSLDVINAKHKETKSVDTAIGELKTPLTSMRKRILKTILPWGRNAVGYREQTKSLVIKLVDWLRRTCHRLGHLFVQEGLLVDQNLIFYLTLEEIKLLTEGKFKGVVSKALKRRHIQPHLETLEFPEIMIGIPNPTEDRDLPRRTPTFVLEGTPVCQGIVTARARVVLCLAEAASLQSGEVLVTHSTDIGWSPYFPLLSGVVTVLGGLISHGAVVAREYGLPCVVGVQNATSLLKSGDLIILDGTKGKITKLNDDEKKVNNELNNTTQ